MGAIDAKGGADTLFNNFPYGLGTAPIIQALLMEGNINRNDLHFSFFHSQTQQIAFTLPNHLGQLGVLLEWGVLLKPSDNR